MVRLTWELRYPVFLLIFLIITPTTQFPPTDLNRKDCIECSNSCKNNTLKQLDLIDGSCQQCGCLGSSEYIEEFKKTHPHNIPFLYSTPSLTLAGTNAEFTCIRWCDSDCTAINVRNEMSLKSGNRLPDVRQQLLYSARAGGMWLSILNLTLTVDAANTFDELRCQVRGETNSSNIARVTLFAFDMSRPVVTGPQKVKTTAEIKWDCLMDFVAMRVPDDVTNRLDIEIEIIDAGYLRATTLGAQYTQKEKNSLKGVKVTKALTLKIPKRLANKAVQVQCTAIQKELWVTNTSLPLKVSVIGDKAVVEIGAKLTTGGAGMGSVAVIITVSFAIHYVFRKLQARGATRSPVQDQETPQPNTRGTGGILKKPPKSALKKPSGGMSKAYSAFTEEDPESSMADSGSIVIGDLPEDVDLLSSLQPAPGTATTAGNADATATPTTTATTTPATATTTPPPPAAAPQEKK